MKKLIFPLILLLFTATAARAQSGTHRIVFQLQTADSLVHKSLMKQLNNILTVAPGSELEVVCHGPGLQMLLTDKSRVSDKVAVLTVKGVHFVACEFSMSEQKVGKDKLIPAAGIVPYGLLEIVGKQEAGWSYIKSGF